MEDVIMINSLRRKSVEELINELNAKKPAPTPEKIKRIRLRAADYAEDDDICRILGIGPEISRKDSAFLLSVAYMAEVEGFDLDRYIANRIAALEKSNYVDY